MIFPPLAEEWTLEEMRGYLMGWITAKGGEQFEFDVLDDLYQAARAIKGDLDSSGRSSDSPGETEDASAKKVA